MRRRSQCWSCRQMWCSTNCHPCRNPSPTALCSTHRPNCYPIWDSRVRKYLLWLQQERDFAKDFMVDGSWKYSAFRETISFLREQYGLNEFSFKDLDKFLYLAGNVLIKAEESN